MKNLYLRERPIKGSKNKNYIIQISVNKLYMFWQVISFKITVLDDDTYFGFYFNLLGDFLDIKLDWTRRKDHAGFCFNFKLLWLDIDISTYDKRHWDYEKEQWK